MYTPITRHSSLSTLLIALAVCGTQAAHAQSYPVKPIRIIVPFAPGGGTDVMARLLAQKLTQALGQQVVVDNRGGAGGTIGTELAIRADPDGYTFLLSPPGYAINPSMYSLKFDPLADYTPVVLAAKGPFVVIVHPSLPVKTLRELTAMAKARPGELLFGTAGQGGITHLASELYLDMAKVKMTHVPYKGGGPAMIDLISGQVSVVFAPAQTGLPQARAGRVRVLAVTSAERIPAEPQLATVAESGVPGYEVVNWFAFIGPKGVPRTIVERLNREINRAVRLPDVVERLAADGLAPLGGPPEDLHARIAKEIVQWRQVVTRAKIRVE
jgi:tripartite-type tricarboxylate transporter receptor subunit TctC